MTTKLPAEKLAACAAQFPPSYEHAQSILGLGTGFIPPERVAASAAIHYADEERAVLAATLPPPDMLRECADNDMVCVAGPPQPMTLQAVLNLRARLASRGEWLLDDVLSPIAGILVNPGWIAIHIGSAPESRSEAWGEQQKHVHDPDSIPNVAEALWCDLCACFVSGRSIFSGVRVRTLSVDALGRHVTLGFCDRRGVHLGYADDGVRDSTMGLALCRRFLLQT